MKYEEFKRQLGKAGLSVKEFALLIKHNPASITNYSAKGEVPSHLAIIATLMGEMAELGIDYRAVLTRGSVEAKNTKVSSPTDLGK